MQQLEYNPTLETVLMVEKTIKKFSGELGITNLWKKLPRKVMYQTYRTVVDYLLESNKIIIGKDGKVIWIWNQERIKRILSEGLKVR